MNDFTKDELNVLLKCARLTEIEFGDCTDIDNAIYKLQTIIDSYCDHESADIDYDYQALRCQKCKEIVE